MSESTHGMPADKASTTTRPNCAASDLMVVVEKADIQAVVFSLSEARQCASVVLIDTVGSCPYSPGNSNFHI